MKREKQKMFVRDEPSGSRNTRRDAAVKRLLAKGIENMSREDLVLVCRHRVQTKKWK